MTIDIYQIHNFVSLTGSFNDDETLQAIRNLRAALEQSGARLEDVVHYAVTSDDFWQSLSRPAQTAPSDEGRESGGGASGGLALCRWTSLDGQPGIETAPPDGTPKQWVIAGNAANQAENIAEHLKDALVVASINKCSLKIKLKDIKDEDEKTMGTLVQAEYDKDLAPIIIWSGDRGDAASLASTLRQAAAHATNS